MRVHRRGYRREAGTPVIKHMAGVVIPMWPALSYFVRGGGCIGATAYSAVGAVKAEKKRV